MTQSARVDPESIAYASIRQIREWVAGDPSVLCSLAESHLERLHELNPRLNAFLGINERLVDDARHLESRVRADASALPLAGAVVSVKDLMPVAGMPTTAGSKVIGAETAADDAPVVARLRAAGCLISGKTNLHEFAFGVTTENEHFGPALNPWAADRIAGGSSGGSAAAVAAGLGQGSVGSDTRGSIRIPSSCCSVTGLKPTRGLVPTEGVLPLSWTLDHVGPLARTVDEVFELVEVMAARRVESFPLEGLRLGRCDGFLMDLEAGVQTVVEEALRTLESLGLEVVEVQLRQLEAARQASDVIARAEAAAFHDRWLQTRPEAYGPGVRSRLMSGYELSAVDLVRAQRVVGDARRDFEAAFERVDVLIAPVLPCLPPKLGAVGVAATSDGPSVASLVRFNAPQNVAGVPALALPGGFIDGLPVGVQLIAAWDREGVLRSAGQAFQEATDWHRRRPVLRQPQPGE